MTFHSSRKQNLWRVFVDGLIDNDEKVAFFKKNIPNSGYTIYDQNVRE